MERHGRPGRVRAGRTAGRGAGQRPGRILRLAVGQPAAAGQHAARDGLRGHDRLRGRRLRHAAEDDRRGRHVVRSAGRHVLQPDRGAGDRRQHASSPAAAASRGCRPTAARRFSRIAFTPVESSCPDGLAPRGALVRQRRSTATSCSTTGRSSRRPTAAALRDQDRDPRHQAGRRRRGADRRGLHAATPAASSRPRTATSTPRPTRGVSWKSVSETNRAVRAITFASATVGYAVGDGSLFLKTTDGGATWVAEGHRRPAQNLTAIRCADEKACVATTATGTQLVITVDGGATFSSPTPSTDPLFAAAFASPRAWRPPASRARRSSPTTRAPNFAPDRRPAARARSRGSCAGKVAGTAFAPGPDGDARQDRRRRQDVDARQRHDVGQTSWTSRSRRPTPATRSTSPAGCSSRRRRAASGRRWTPAARRGRARSTRRRRRPSWSSGRPACGARSTAAGRSTRSRAARSRARRCSASTAPAARSSPTAPRT